MREIGHMISKLLGGVYETGHMASKLLFGGHDTGQMTSKLLAGCKASINQELVIVMQYVINVLFNGNAQGVV